MMEVTACVVKAVWNPDLKIKFARLNVIMRNVTGIIIYVEIVEAAALIV